MVDTCQWCGGEAEEPHPCPLRSELGNDDETLCNCCDTCKYDCAMDV